MITSDKMPLKMSKSQISKYPLISIVIPSLNKAEYIKQTLDSIFTQRYPNLEVIIQDGGSKDQTKNIVTSYIKMYPQIAWVSKKDNGQVDAINKGLKKAKGDILTYINADDIYLNNSLFEVAQSYQKYPESLWLVGKGVVINKDGEINSSFFVKQIVGRYKDLLLKLNSYNLLLILNYFMQPSVFIT